MMEFDGALKQCSLCDGPPSWGFICRLVVCCLQQVLSPVQCGVLPHQLYAAWGFYHVIIFEWGIPLQRWSMQCLIAHAAEVLGILIYEALAFRNCPGESRGRKCSVVCHSSVCLENQLLMDMAIRCQSLASHDCPGEPRWRKCAIVCHSGVLSNSST